MATGNEFRSARNLVVNQEGACQICAALRKFQSACVEGLQHPLPSLLCRLHTWEIARWSEASAAADMLLQMLGHVLEEGSSTSSCDICERIAQEEKRQLEDFSKRLLMPTYIEWFRDNGELCFPHARKLFDRVPEEFRNVIVSVIQREIVDLKTQLITLSRTARVGAPAHPGVLGRTAEYLVGKRGLVF